MLNKSFKKNQRIRGRHRGARLLDKCFFILKIWGRLVLSKITYKILKTMI